MNESTDCIFCEILAGTAAAAFVHQDSLCSAFMDIQPINPGHMLVVPNRHAARLAELKEEEGTQIFRIAHRLAAAVRMSGLRCEGVNLFLADGGAAMQEVPHVHLHVFPRYVEDGFGLTFPPDYPRALNVNGLEAVAERIRVQVELLQPNKALQATRETRAPES